MDDVGSFPLTALFGIGWASVFLILHRCPCEAFQRHRWFESSSSAHSTVPFFSEWKCHFSSATTEFGNTCTIFLDHRGRDLCKVAMPRELKQLRKQPDLVDQYAEAFAQEERLKTVLASVSFQWSGMLSLN